MNEDFLVRGYVKLLDDLFKPENYYARCRVLNDNRGKVYAQRDFDSSTLRAVGNVFYQHLVKRPDWQCVKHMAKTAASNPQALPEAIAQAVKFYHFRKITDGLVKARGYQEHTATLYEQFQQRLGSLQTDASAGVAHARELATRALQDAENRYHKLSDPAKEKAEPYLRALREKLHMHHK
jgi:hypothetical protein